MGVADPATAAGNSFVAAQTEESGKLRTIRPAASTGTTNTAAGPEAVNCCTPGLTRIGSRAEAGLDAMYSARALLNAGYGAWPWG